MPILTEIFGSRVELPGGGHVDVLLTDDQKEDQNGTVDPRSAGEVPTAEVGSIHIQKSGGRILHLP